MSLRMIGRADDGGLGTQAWENARHLSPDRVLIVDSAPRRGVFRPERFDMLCDWRVTDVPPSVDDIRWLCDGGSTLLAAETFYIGDTVPYALTNDVRLVLLVNPELFPVSHRFLADQGRMDVIAPTTWEVNRLGKHRVIPQPIALDRFIFEPRNGPARTFLHVSSPAMLDRNGTQLVRAACEVYVGPPITLLVAGTAKPAAQYEVGYVTIVPVADVDDYWQRWNADVDVLVQPRRYGGLSMIVQEAAAAGAPTICLDREPERGWPGTMPVPVTGLEPADMKGGIFGVAQARALDVADMMRVAATTDLRPLSIAAREWAESIGWHRLHDVWTAALL